MSGLVGGISRGFESFSCYQQTINTIIMNVYITSDKIGEFISIMYEKGIKVEADPMGEQLCVTKPNGGYEWIKIYRKSSFDELCKMFDQPSEN